VGFENFGKIVVWVIDKRINGLLIHGCCGIIAGITESLALEAAVIGLGTAVVATKFRGAKDMFSNKQGEPDGSGVLVDFRNVEEIDKGLRKMFENPSEIETKAYRKGVTMGWSVVGKQMVNLLYDVTREQSEIETTRIPFVE